MRTLRQIPTQQMRDALLKNMIVYQAHGIGQRRAQRYLFETGPPIGTVAPFPRHDRRDRHGCRCAPWLVDHFGYSGKVEAQKMLERRGSRNKRLLGAFNR